MALVLLLLGVAAGDAAPLEEARSAASAGRARTAGVGAGDAGEVARLAEEVREKGWIVFGSKTERGDWDLFLSRPDGSSRRNITSTPEHNEAAPQFSRDGSRVLYRRLPRDEPIDGNLHGIQGELVLARSDGSRPEALGPTGEHPWASWGPDGREIASLSIRGIHVVDLETRRPVRRLERKGFFQQLIWSADGRWLCGVANSYDTGWSVAVMDAATGAAHAVSRIDCCTPDWFPDSAGIIFSRRPPGQKGNGGQGWTQLWMARPQAAGEDPPAARSEGAGDRVLALVYGEDGRHVYGGHVSPDGRYALFTGNVREDGDPGRAGAPMGLLRLSDAPIVGGESPELRALHPQAARGPVLVLPDGWEPCWTFSEAPLGGSTPLEPAASAGGARTAAVGAGDAGEVARLAEEVREKGWIVFGSKTERGDWDLFLSRPDGSSRRNITSTPEHNEAGARFSPDSRRLLYHRVPRDIPLDNNAYGEGELVIADPDGGRPVALGEGFPWASWSPDSKRIACLVREGIRIVDPETRAVVRTLARRGIVQQLVWSPAGRSFLGTANGLGPYWAIGHLDIETGEIRAASETDRYGCTPDWFPDGRRLVYSRGIVPEEGGWAELWWASADGAERGPIHAEEGRHVYGGCISPDGRHALFTRSAADLGKVDGSGTTMSIVRIADAPIVIGSARGGPRLDIAEGWEPHWTEGDLPPGDGDRGGER